MSISLLGDSQQDDDGNVEASKSQVKTSMKIPLPGDSQDKDRDEDSNDNDDEDGNKSPALLCGLVSGLGHHCGMRTNKLSKISAPTSSHTRCCCYLACLMTQQREFQN